MATVAEELTELVRRAAVAAGHGESKITLERCLPTNDPRFGDYQSNFAFRLGKSLRTNPRAVAAAMVEALPENDLVASAEVAGPGFINFRLDDRWLARDVVSRASDRYLGSCRAGTGRTLVIDYSSPNVAKRMHVGHLRSTVIGNALHRIHEFLGWRVIADNHIGDWGTQFGMLIVAWGEWRSEDAYAEDPIAELQRLYQLFRERAEEDRGLLDRARAQTALLQQGDVENLKLWKQFVDASLQEFNAVYERLGISFDVTLGESFYRDGLGPLVARLLEDGTAVLDDGAVIVSFTEADGKGLKSSPLLIRKRDGAALYGTTDLATVEYRMSQWQPERIAYVTDVRQQLHFRQLFAACRRMGIEVDFQHAWFGMLRFADGAVAATRSGQIVNLVDVLDTAVDYARKVVDAKSAALPEEQRAAIAEAIGIGAVLYTDLSQNPQSDIVFEWNKMLSLEGNTAPYLMYAHARCHSILRRAGVVDAPSGEVVLGCEAERQLALALVRIPEAVSAAARHWRPNLLAEQLFLLASSLSAFYRECRVLGDDIDPATTQSRLTLCWATATTLERGLSLLGLRAPERM